MGSKGKSFRIDKIIANLTDILKKKKLRLYENSILAKYLFINRRKYTVFTVVIWLDRTMYLHT